MWWFRIVVGHFNVLYSKNPCVFSTQKKKKKKEEEGIKDLAYMQQKGKYYDQKKQDKYKKEKRV